ncbi:MAG TPA: hypothetical protein VFZ69_08010 [Longimicrobiales bacterium]
MWLLVLAAGCADPGSRPESADTSAAAAPTGDSAPPAVTSPDRNDLADTLAHDTYVEHSERVWEAARERGVAFRAVGQEPGWLLEVHRSGAVTLVTDYGADTTAAQLPVSAVQRPDTLTALRIGGAEGPLRVDIRAERCTDTMSGERFSRSVAVVLRGIEYLGCGRALTAP